MVTQVTHIKLWKSFLLSKIARQLHVGKPAFQKKTARVIPQ